MIPQRDLSWQTQSWQEQMMNSVRSSSKLLEILGIEPGRANLSRQAAENFPVLVPHAFVARMAMGDPDDPLLRQVLNTALEDESPQGYISDPLQEAQYNPVKGLIRKYRNRALMIVTSKCAIHCRYCFRREFPYQENNPGRDDWQDALDYLRRHPEIDEIILSGGDPLSASDRHLQWLMEQLSSIAFLKRLRIHTRLPVVIPSRITEDFVSILSASRLPVTLVLHINHANEINDELKLAICHLKNSARFVLNQSVLLNGVNDNLDTQVNLQAACVDAGILPYYLHVLDPVRGASHFDVSRDRALSLYRQMQAQLSGYMLPKLVVETAGGQSKQFLH